MTGGVRWEVRRGTVVSKPISEDRLRELARAEKIQPGDEIRRVGDEAWRSAASVLGSAVAGAHRYDVFVSHSAKDKSIADATVHYLESRGIRCWIAPRDVLPGSNWAASIIEGLGQCRVFVLVCSSHSNKSQQVLQEVERAVAKDLIVIPLRVEQVVLSDALELYLGARHWLDAISRPIEKHLGALADAVAQILDTPLVDRAYEQKAEKKLGASKKAVGQYVSKLDPKWLTIGAVGVLLLAVLLIVVSRGGGDDDPRDERDSARVDHRQESTPSVGHRDVQRPTDDAESSDTEEGKQRLEQERRETERQRALLIEATSAGSRYEQLMRCTQSTSRRLTLTFLASSDDIFLEVADVPRSARRWFYRGTMRLTEQPRAWWGVSGSTEVRGWAVDLEVDGALNVAGLGQDDPFGEGRVSLAVPEGSSTVEVYAEVGADRRSLALAEESRSRVPLPTANDFVDRISRALPPSRTWEAEVGGSNQSRVEVEVHCLGLDDRAGAVYLEVRPEGDATRSTLFRGRFASDSSAAQSWPLRLDMIEPFGVSEDVAILGTRADSIWFAAPESDTVAGLRAFVGSDGSRLDLVDYEDTHREIPTPSGLRAMMRLGSRYEGTVRTGAGSRVPVEATVVGFDGASEVSIRIEAASTSQYLALYEGAVSTTLSDRCGWPIRLEKSESRAYPSSPTDILAQEARTMVLRAIDGDRLVGRSNDSVIDLSRIGSTADSSVWNDTAIRERLTSILDRGRVWAGRMILGPDAIDVSMHVVEAPSRDGTVVVTLNSDDSASPDSPARFEARLATDDRSLKTWPLDFARKTSRGDALSGWFGSGALDLVLREAGASSEAAPVLEGWCGKRSIRFERTNEFREVETTADGESIDEPPTRFEIVADALERPGKRQGNAVYRGVVDRRQVTVTYDIEIVDVKVDRRSGRVTGSIRWVGEAAERESDGFRFLKSIDGMLESRGENVILSFREDDYRQYRGRDYDDMILRPGESVFQGRWKQRGSKHSGEVSLHVRL